MKLRMRSIVLGLGALSWGTAMGQVTARVSVGLGGANPIGASADPSISTDGRFVAFSSAASNLVPGDTNGIADIFVRDRATGTTERVNVGAGGVQADGDCQLPQITPDGRFVVFDGANAGTLVPGATGNQVFVVDRQGGTLEIVSVNSSGQPANSLAWKGSITPDGRYVAFESWATNLVPNDHYGSMDVFVHDRVTGTTEILSWTAGGFVDAQWPSISADGRFVAFESDGYLTPIGGPYRDVFVRDVQTDTTELVSVDSAGGPQNAASYSATISADGRYVAFVSDATNLVPGDTNGQSDVFVHDRQTGTTVRVDVASDESQAAMGADEAQISALGRYVVFASASANLVPGDTNGQTDVFRRDLLLGTTERISLGSGGEEGNQASTSGAISRGGSYIAFVSAATTLIPGDTGVADVFVRDVLGGPSFTSLCEPGAEGVIACPCGNPPSGEGRGCNNSSGTGGALLSASGGTYLSSDSLVFHTVGEKPTALSLVSQWNGSNAAGVALGMGVRCTSGSLKRLFTKTAVGGSITAPDFGVGDPTVSARSAAKGDIIAPGQSRWYYVYYRDPVVLGGCPASSTFNATQTGEIAWAP